MQCCFFYAGCDTVSSFANFGKQKCWMALQEMSLSDVENLQSLGKSSTVSDKTMDGCKRFVKLLYGSKVANMDTLAKLREHLVFKYESLKLHF